MIKIGNDMSGQNVTSKKRAQDKDNIFKLSVSNMRLGTEMTKATRLSTSIIGVYAGILGIVHGYFETLQGNISTNGIMIKANYWLSL